MVTEDFASPPLSYIACSYYWTHKAATDAMQNSNMGLDASATTRVREKSLPASLDWF